jgi:hypothetical protein
MVGLRPLLIVLGIMMLLGALGTALFGSGRGAPERDDTCWGNPC